MSSQSRQIKAGVLYLGATFLDSLAPLITLPLFTRILSSEDFGVLALAQVYALLVGGLANFGMATAYNRNYFEYCEDKQKTGELFFTTISFVAVLSSFLLFLTLVFENGLSKVFLRSDYHGSILFWALTANVLANLRLFFLTYLRNTERPKQYVINAVCLTVLTLILSVCFVMIIKMGVIGILYGQVLASFLILVALLIQFLSELPVRWNTKLLIEELKIGGPTVPAVFFSLLNNHIDKYLIALMSGVGGVGLYSIGQKIATMVFTFMTSLQNVFSPGIYQRMFVDKAGFSDEISKYLLPFIYLVVLFALIIALFAEEIVVLCLAPQFYGAVDVVIILSVFYSILFFVKVSGDQLIFSKKMYLLTVIMIIGGILNVAINIPFIIRWGAVGAAMATLFSRFIVVIVIITLAQRYYKILWQARAISSIYTLLFLSAGGLAVLRILDTAYLLRLIFKLGMLSGYFYLAVRLGLFKSISQLTLFQYISRFVKKGH